MLNLKRCLYMWWNCVQIIAEVKINSFTFPICNVE